MHIYFRGLCHKSPLLRNRSFFQPNKKLFKTCNCCMHSMSPVAVQLRLFFAKSKTVLKSIQGWLIQVTYCAVQKGCVSQEFLMVSNVGIG